MTQHHILPSWRSKANKYGCLLQAALKGRQTKDISGGDGVLIIEGGHIGDILMDASALYALVKHYQGMGKDVSFLCSPPLWNMLSRVYNMQGVCYVGELFSYANGVDFGDVGKVLGYLKEKKFEIIIANCNTDARIHCLVANISAFQKWGIVASMTEKGIKKQLKAWMLHPYTKIVWGDKNKFQLRWLENLLKELKIETYHTHNVFIPIAGTVQTPEKQYIAIAVDSADMRRRWPAQNYAELIRKLLCQYSMDVCLIGTSMPQDMRDLLNDEFLHTNKRVIDLVGKTSISEWIEVIRNSCFLIGVDSGAIHVAAAVGTPSFCLTGVWSAHRCMPYNVDAVTDGTVLPLCIYRHDENVEQLHCFDCVARGKLGSGNAACAAQVKAGGGLLCLSKITPDDVMTAIQHAQETGAI